MFPVLLTAARPRTWVTAISPIGIALALAANPDFLICAWTFLFALTLQIGTNWANDYYDFCHGVDNAARVGPPRAVQSGWISPIAMRNSAFLMFGVAILASVPLLLQVGKGYFIAVLVAAMCGLFYTAGPKPLGYLGLGDALVLFFYGPVAVLGTLFAMHESISGIAIIASFAPGLLSSALLTINNLRDREGDALQGKNTLVVRLGDAKGKKLYQAYLISALCIPCLVAILADQWLLSLVPLLLFNLYQKAMQSVMAACYREAFVFTLAMLCGYTFLFYCFF